MASQKVSVFLQFSINNLPRFHLSIFRFITSLIPELPTMSYLQQLPDQEEYPDQQTATTKYCQFQQVDFLG